MGNIMGLFRQIAPKSIAGQMITLMAASFGLLLLVLAAFEFMEYDSVVDTSGGEYTAQRLQRILPILESITSSERSTYLKRISHCHDGYRLGEVAYPDAQTTQETQNIALQLSKALSMPSNKVNVGFANFEQSDFAYSDCNEAEIKFPIEGIVVSVELAPQQWLLAEIHPHEWHFTPTMSDWLLRSGIAFLMIGGVAIIFVRRLSKPFASLTEAATTFASDLEVTDLEETGPPDVKNAIRSFNMMQRQVTDEMQRRTNTLAAISHDIRSPLTALRVKAELIEDDNIRADQIASIEKMERITSSALDFLKGESRGEKKRIVDLGVLVESECEDFKEAGADIDFVCNNTIQIACRPDALSRAVRNLIENAVKYGGRTHVKVLQSPNDIRIEISDEGPGIPKEKLEEALQPFTRLSDAREGDNGGFGLGLAIVHAVVEGHDGKLDLGANEPKGLVAMITLARN